MAAQSSLARLPLVAKFGIGAGLLILVGVAYFVVFYGEVSSSIKAAQRTETQKRTELQRAQTRVKEYDKDLAELKDRELRQRELNKVLPKNTEYPSFLSSVQSVANVAGVSLSAWTPQEEVPEQFYARVPMKLELEGRYHQVAKFFYGVGQIDRIINMENISITDPKLEGDEFKVKVEALATAFHTIQNGGQPAPAQPGQVHRVPGQASPPSHGGQP